MTALVAATGTSENGIPGHAPLKSAVIVGLCGTSSRLKGPRDHGAVRRPIGSRSGSVPNPTIGDPMPGPVLFCYDGSEGSRGALRRARSLGRPYRPTKMSRHLRPALPPNAGQVGRSRGAVLRSRYGTRVRVTERAFCSLLVDSDIDITVAHGR